ncbi:hypothetical protein F4775DRAFT_587662 [Biscogniauxia sp. FL1348]|nr:hypothetical protein F4775DRAFT_587662 [Biscogniauxia sp. FL1348]
MLTARRLQEHEYVFALLQMQRHLLFRADKCLNRRKCLHHLQAHHLGMVREPVKSTGKGQRQGQEITLTPVLKPPQNKDMSGYGGSLSVDTSGRPNERAVLVDGLDWIAGAPVTAVFLGYLPTPASDNHRRSLGSVFWSSLIPTASDQVINVQSADAIPAGAVKRKFPALVQKASRLYLPQGIVTADRRHEIIASLLKYRQGPEEVQLSHS